MAAQRDLIQEMAREDLAGTTYTTCSLASRLSLTVVYDPFLCQLNLLIRSGDCVYQSEWLAVENQLPSQVMAAHIQEAVRLWLLRTGSPSRGQKNGLTPLELATRTMNQFEHILA